MAKIEEIITEEGRHFTISLFGIESRKLTKSFEAISVISTQVDSIVSEWVEREVDKAVKAATKCSVCGGTDSVCAKGQEKAIEAAVKAAVERCAKAICPYCEMGWIVEGDDHGWYHRVPPENKPISYLNKKCRATEIRRAQGATHG